MIMIIRTMDGNNGNKDKRAKVASFASKAVLAIISMTNGRQKRLIKKINNR
jgi:hypothetical protein